MPYTLTVRPVLEPIDLLLDEDAQVDARWALAAAFNELDGSVSFDESLDAGERAEAKAGMKTFNELQKHLAEPLGEEEERRQLEEALELARISVSQRTGSTGYSLANAREDTGRIKRLEALLAQPTARPAFSPLKRERLSGLAEDVSLSL